MLTQMGVGMGIGNGETACKIDICTNARTYRRLEKLTGEVKTVETYLRLYGVV